MIAVGRRQKVDHLLQALYTLFTTYKTALNAHQQAPYAKAAATRGNNVRIVFRVNAIKMYTLRR